MFADCVTPFPNPHLNEKNETQTQIQSHTHIYTQDQTQTQTYTQAQTENQTHAQTLLGLFLVLCLGVVVGFALRMSEDWAEGDRRNFEALARDTHATYRYDCHLR